MNRLLVIALMALSLVAGNVLSAQAVAGDDSAAEDSPTESANKSAAENTDGKYELRYKFNNGDVYKWEVQHEVQVRTTIAGSTQLAETLSKSLKVWRVRDFRKKDSIAILAHGVEYVDMTHKLTGREDMHYDSRTDEKPPAGFEQVAGTVGKVLTAVEIDPTGKVLKRKDLLAAENRQLSNQLTIPLPEEAIAIGENWTIPSTTDLPMRDRTTRKIKLQQRYTLQSVDDGIATIIVETQILTPVQDPEIQVQLVQMKTNGTIKFDLEAGRIIEQRLEQDERVVGFQTEASSMSYQSRFTEKLLTDTRPRGTVRALPDASPERTSDDGDSEVGDADTELKIKPRRTASKSSRAKSAKEDATSSDAATDGDDKASTGDAAGETPGETISDEPASDDTSSGKAADGKTTHDKAAAEKSSREAGSSDEPGDEPPSPAKPKYPAESTGSATANKPSPNSQSNSKPESTQPNSTPRKPSNSTSVAKPSRPTSSSKSGTSTATRTKPKSSKSKTVK